MLPSNITFNIKLLIFVNLARKFVTLPSSIENQFMNNLKQKKWKIAKKERMFLTPDIDTQEFLGDIMFSNTYLTQRIPANWEDPE